LHIAGRALQKLHPQHAFEVLNGAAERRLRNVQMRGRLAEMQVAGNGQKSLDMTNLDMHRLRCQSFFPFLVPPRKIAISGPTVENKLTRQTPLFGGGEQSGLNTTKHWRPSIPRRY
jgi:hypothetical protein